MLNSLHDSSASVLNPLAIQTAIVALGISAIGIYGLLREQGSRLSVAYFLLTQSMGIWLFAFSRMYGASDLDLAMWWAKAAYVGIASIPAAAYNFCALVLQDYERLRKRILAVWIASAVFIALILTTDIQFNSLYHYSWGYFPKADLTSIPFTVYFFAIMALALHSYIAGYRNVVRNSTQQRRSRVLLIAFSAGSLGAVDFLGSFGIPWYPVGHIAIFLFTVISGYSIVRYRFMPITAAFAARQIIDTMKGALLVVDPDGIIRLVNRASCVLFKRSEQDLVGKRPVDALNKPPAFGEALETVLRSGTVTDHEVEYVDEVNETRTLSVTTTTMQNPLAEPLAFVCVINDITDRKRDEKERERLLAQFQSANEKLQELDKMKSDFISVASHELRTPLTTIKAFAELLALKPDMPEQRKKSIISTVNGEADRLTLLISDLLDISRIESGKMMWRINSVSMEDVVRKTIANMTPLFEDKGLRLTTEFTSPLASLSGDYNRLVQVVTNIISNAVKFTPRGGLIRVAMREEPAPARIVMEISDTGVGIPTEDLELIFEKFHRSKNKLASMIEGTGLGLAIARQIVEHHGGKIWACSTPGKGSMFTVTLPIKS